jgi:hypothetical protein
MEKGVVELLTAVISLAANVITFLKAIFTRPEGARAKPVALTIFFAVLGSLAFYLHVVNIKIVSLAIDIYDDYFGPTRYLRPSYIQVVKVGQRLIIRSDQAETVPMPTNQSVYFQVLNGGTVKMFSSSPEHETPCVAQFWFHTPSEGRTIKLQACERQQIVLVERIDRGLTFQPR